MTHQPFSQAPDESLPKPLPLRGTPLPDELLHQLGTPLTIISGHTQLLRRRTRHVVGDDVATLDRSLKGIERAVQSMITVLMEGDKQEKMRNRLMKILFESTGK